MTLEDYRAQFGWSKAEMARQARVDGNTLNKALNGELITSNSANKIARAISKELGRPIRAQDIEGLNIIE